MMNFNFSQNNDVNDEEFLRKEEEAKNKEIQELILKEFNNFDLNDEENVVRDRSNDISTDQLDESTDSRFDYNISNDSNEKENFLVNTDQYFVKWNGYQAPGTFGNDFIYQNSTGNYQFLQTNNNYISDSENSKTWEISLHDEMGIPLTENNKYFSKNSEKPPINKNVQKTNSKLPKPNLTIPINKPSIVIKHDVAVECIPANQREMDNLELLYDARGKHIDQLQAQLSTEKEQRLKDSRILRHQLTLLEAEKRNLQQINQNLSTDASQIRDNLTQLQDKHNQLNTQFELLQEEVSRLQLVVSARDEVIENLNQQLIDIRTNNNMTRHTEQENDLLDSLSHQYDSETYRLKQQLKRINQRLDERDELLVAKDEQLDSQTRSHNNERMQWRVEVQKLETLLNSKSEEIAQLENCCNQAKLTAMEKTIANLTTDKSISADVIDCMQMEINELNQQINQLELSITNQPLCELESQTNHKTPSLPDLSCSDSSSSVHQQHMVSYTHRITQQILQAHKLNLQLKIDNRHLQQSFELQNKHTLSLENQVKDLTKRLEHLNQGLETDEEKQLKKSVESLEKLKSNLEENCQLLQSQVETFNKTVDAKCQEIEAWKQSYEELSIKSESDREQAVSEVKSVCDKHYNNLRYQLELNWSEQQQELLNQENQRRTVIEKDLKDALNEIDRVKNLYIELCQQKTEHDVDQENWSNWLQKKLDEQKQSLNQQFKNDKQLLIKQIQAESAFELDLLRKELAQLKTVQVTKVCGCSQTEEDIEYDSGSNQKINQMVQTIDDVVMRELNEYKQLYSILKDKNSLLEKELVTLQSQLQTTITRNSTAINTNTNSSNYQNIRTNMPNIIRSSTPNLVQNTIRPPTNNKPTQNYVTNTNCISTQNFNQEFMRLKQELIGQLNSISKSMEKIKSTQVPITKQRHESMKLDQQLPLSVMSRVQQHFKDWLLDVQARAALTLQRELQLSARHVHQTLLDRLMQILPLYMSVEARVITIEPHKIKRLNNKLNLLLNQIKSNPETLCNVDATNTSCNADAAINSFQSMTSTPKPSIQLGLKSAFHPHSIGDAADSISDITNEAHTDFSDDISSIHSEAQQKYHFKSGTESENNHDEYVSEEYRRLTQEIQQLSHRLFDNLPPPPSLSPVNINSSLSHASLPLSSLMRSSAPIHHNPQQPINLFDYVDHHNLLANSNS